MRKAFSLFIAASILLLISCSTSGDDSMRPVDRTVSLIETLAAAEEAPLVQLPSESSSVPEAAVPAEMPEEIPEPEPVAVQEAEAVPVIQEPAESLPAAEDAAMADDVREDPSAEESAPAGIIPEPAEEVPEAIPEAVSEPEPEPMPAVPEPAAEAEPVPAAVPAESAEAMPMDSWMTELMVVLVVIITLFTGAGAIRNAYRAPLPRLIASAISILVTALAWVLSLVIAGPSEVYPVYLILLTVYIVLRSKGRS